MIEQKIVVFYHGNCPDGFGGAYAAWKKFGDSAAYVPLKYGKAFDYDVTGKEVYFIDFSFPKPEMDAIAAKAGAFTALDHHEGTKDVVESMPNHVYDVSRSGAVIAWQFFHPDTPVPLLLQYVQEGDLYRFALPNSHAILTYVYTRLFEFTVWDELERMLEDETELARIIDRGSIYNEYTQLLVDKIVKDAEPVRFEGYDVYLASCARAFVSYVGNLLAKEHPPLALIVSVRGGELRVSMRGNGTVDLSKIAQKYGGNGHPNAAAFIVPLGTTPPWTPREK
jgi:oligoribonuclease NrnB/cAMP/cGMP phosphodiesterase (DHH superfamily)